MLHILLVVLVIKQINLDMVVRQQLDLNACNQRTWDKLLDSRIWDRGLLIDKFLITAGVLELEVGNVGTQSKQMLTERCL